jgi:hypothetical protein
MARYPELEIVRVGDIDVDRAKRAADEHAIPAWGTTRTSTPMTRSISW